MFFTDQADTGAIAVAMLRALIIQGDGREQQMAHERRRITGRSEAVIAGQYIDIYQQVVGWFWHFQVDKRR